MSVVIGIVLLGILVFLHEMGHFAASRICGVKVEAFSVGMGPVLLHKRLFGTDWRLSLLPFGGYCSMKGEKDIYEDDFDEFTQKDPDSFYGKKPIFRAVIGAAGPFANFLFAAFAFMLVGMWGCSYYTEEPLVQIPEETESAAQKAGIRDGDRILSIGGEEIENFSQLRRIVSENPDEELIFVVERKSPDGETERLEFSVHTDFEETESGKVGRVGLMTALVESERLSPFRAVHYGFLEALKLTREYALGVASLFSKNSPPLSESLSGPARITTMLGSSASGGFSSVMTFMAYISIALFFMNLLPLPVLDGFLVLISLVEAFFKIRIPKKARFAAQIVGISLIFLLFFIATASDIRYFLGFLNEAN